MTSAFVPTDMATTVLTEHSPALPLVNISIALRTGSELDPLGKEGLSEILVRLMRRNAGGRDASDNDRIVDSLGGSLGADVVPSTMGFHGSVIARSFGDFITLLSDTVNAPGFQQDELERLKREMHSELIESLDNDRAIARRWFRRKLFQGHSYGRPVSGTSASLASISLDDVKNLYAQAFVRDNVVFAFAGDVDPALAAVHATSVGEKLPSGQPSTAPRQDPSAPAGRRLVLVDKPERTQTQILVGGLGTHPLDDDHTALHVGNTIFGGTFTARLTQEVRSKRGWSYGAYSSLPVDRSRQAFSMWTFPKAGDAAACLKLELDLLKDWCERGITKKELALAKRYLVRSHAFAIDTAAKRVGLKLDSEIYQLPTGYYEDYEARVQAVTLDEVNEAIQKRISFENLLVVVVGTAKDIETSIIEAVDKLDGHEVVAFDDLG
jgi:zinc protease